MLKEQLEILEVFRRDLLLEESIRGIMKKTGSKSYGRIFDSVQNLLKENILVSKKQGKSTVCSLNLSNLKTKNLLAFLASLDSDKSINDEDEKTFLKLFSLNKSYYYSVLIHFRDKNKKELDLVLIVDDEVDSNRYLNTLNSYLKVNSIPIHPHVIKSNEFIQMLLSREDNFGKILFREAVVFFGALNYYSLISEALEHGLHI